MLNNLAVIYNATVQYARAEELFQRALAIQERTLGSEHPELYKILHNLAGCYRCSEGTWRPARSNCARWLLGRKLLA
jgi:hypothetical protein